jgi:REP-associated tyrosine transposase
VHGGYREIQDPPERYRLIELTGLSALCGFASVADYQRAHRQWVEDALLHETGKRDKRWSEALAVGSQAFVEKVKHELATKAGHRDVDEADGTYALREPASAYTGSFGTENGVLSAGNAIFWACNPLNA